MTVGAVRRLFALPPGTRDFEAARDGRRFLLVVPSRVPEPESLRVVVDWAVAL